MVHSHDHLHSSIALSTMISNLSDQVPEVAHLQWLSAWQEAMNSEITNSDFETLVDSLLTSGVSLEPFLPILTKKLTSEVRRQIISFSTLKRYNSLTTLIHPQGLVISFLLHHL